MIIRISNEAQYEVPDTALDDLNAIDSELEAAVVAEDEDAFRRELGRLLGLVRERGVVVDDDFLGPSSLILPPADMALSEIAGAISATGLIPD